MARLIVMMVLVAMAAVLVQWSYVAVGVLVVISALIAALMNHRRNRVNIKEFYKGKRVILTGASKGIGKSIAIQLAQLGVKLVIAARSADKLAETQRCCLEHTSHVHTVVADVSQEEDCKTVVEKAVEEFEGVDILILNAAYTEALPMWFTEDPNPEEIFMKCFRVNVLQSVFLVRHALPYLSASKGTIVPVSSAAGIIAMPKTSAYSASKNAMHGFFKCLRQEFIFTNTPVSITIMPLPYVRTEQAMKGWNPIHDGDGITPEDCADRMIRGIPLGKMWYYVDWLMFISSRLYPMMPDFFDSAVRDFARKNSHNYEGL